MLVLNLVLDVLQACLGIQTHPLLSNQLTGKLFIFLFKCAQCLVGLGVEVGLNLSIIPSVLDPLIGYKNFLDSLCKKQQGNTL